MNDHIEIYRRRLNLKHAVFSKIEHADAMVAYVYEVNIPSGEKFILKMSPKDEHFYREVHFLRELVGSLPVPHIVDLIEPEKGIAGAILMQYIPGSLIEKENLTTRLAYEIGLNLAKIHLNKVEGYGDLLCQLELSSNPKKHWFKKFEESVGECHDHLPANLIKQAYKCVEDNIHLIDLADGPCIVHRDYRPGNIMHDQGKLNGILDWASARAGFAQEDFQALSQQEFSDNPEVNAAFLKGYANLRPVPQYKQMMSLLRLSRACATVGYTLKSGTWDTIHAQAYKTSCNILEAILL